MQRLDRFDANRCTGAATWLTTLGFRAGEGWRRKQKPFAALPEGSVRDALEAFADVVVPGAVSEFDGDASSVGFQLLEDGAEGLDRGAGADGVEQCERGWELEEQRAQSVGVFEGSDDAFLEFGDDASAFVEVAFGEGAVGEVRPLVALWPAGSGVAVWAEYLAGSGPTSIWASRFE